MISSHLRHGLSRLALAKRGALAICNQSGSFATATKKLSSNLAVEQAVSPALGVILGKSASNRQDALKGVWAYIKLHNLQDPANKRMIVPDAPLREVFGQDRVSMYEVMKLMAPHITKKGE
jgi:chromatin remodeling complex protein RSC6